MASLCPSSSVGKECVSLYSHNETMHLISCISMIFLLYTVVDNCVHRQLSCLSFLSQLLVSLLFEGYCMHTRVRMKLREANFCICHGHILFLTPSLIAFFSTLYMHECCTVSF